MPSPKNELLGTAGACVRRLLRCTWSVALAENTQAVISRAAINRCFAVSAGESRRTRVVQSNYRRGRCCGGRRRCRMKVACDAAPLIITASASRRLAAVV